MRKARHWAAVLCFSLCAAAPAFSQGAVAAQQPLPGKLQLVDITASTGIHFDHLSSPQKKYIVESMSGGVAVIDYDRDGWPDIYLSNAPDVDMQLAGKKARGALYHNNHDGTFTDVTEHAGVGYPGWAMGVAVGDYNDDGWPDLLVTCFGGIVLYRNNGDGTFTDVTRASGLSADTGWATGATFGDYDGDGKQDLFVAHYVDLDLKDLPTFGSKVTCTYHTVAVQCGPRGLKGSPDALYRNNGDGTFKSVGQQAGVGDAQGFFGLTATWSDLNDDGHLDLLVANDGEQNYLYRNNGNGTFTDIAFQAGVAVNQDGSEQANMGVALGDYQHTGRFGIAITHFSEEYAELYQADKGLSYTDVAYAAGVGRPTQPYVGWGDAFVDVDNDGWPDLLMVNGHVYPQVDAANIGTHYREPKVLFLNQQNGTFLDASKLAGPALQVPQISRGMATADLFNDGHVEAVVENLEGAPMILRPVYDTHPHWIGFELAGQPANRLALNARVRVTAGNLVQVDEVRSGGSYLSQNDLRLHFGLGAHTLVDKVEIFWPGGKTETLTHLSPDRVYSVMQGQGALPHDALKPAGKPSK